ncbi:predicted protein [Chaetomium globosum CBS 148.51]|uniref:Uncharacterized protein n=1 Tax=Chaetomium globosum (strain ATCC 6205 / CBS 148.51 / DSM 1962 / NBRC 6347 / NRRL 1970) TaxID=306901 RepID=Q2HA50_CHAGB|nr:uncharacterized protein CHGG_02904 [Chaetomium globosum CBS 148.51]EAQ90969.1 predicted protein [Chaetomium globosum CBS 148.51]
MASRVTVASHPASIPILRRQRVVASEGDQVHRDAVAFGCNQGSDQNLYCNDQPHVLAAAFRQIWSAGEDLMLKAWYSRRKDDAAEYPKFEKRRPKSRL